MDNNLRNPIRINSKAFQCEQPILQQGNSVKLIGMQQNEIYGVPLISANYEYSAYNNRLISNIPTMQCRAN